MANELLARTVSGTAKSRSLQRWSGECRTTKDEIESLRGSIAFEDHHGILYDARALFSSMPAKCYFYEER